MNSEKKVWYMFLDKYAAKLGVLIEVSMKNKVFSDLHFVDW